MEIRRAPSQSLPFQTALALTPRGLPVSLRPFFQDYTLEAVDPDADAFTVIERTLAWGNRAELAWLFRRYPRERISEMVAEAGWWRLPRRRFHYWLNILQITEYRHSDYQRLWPH